VREAVTQRLTAPPPHPAQPAGKRFFEELDRDGDGRVKLEDLKLCMRCVWLLATSLPFSRAPSSRRKLPERYAHDFLRRAKRGWFSDSLGWEEFASLMHEREAFTLRAYNSLQLNRSGHLSLPAITSSLTRLGLPATEENGAAMLRYLGRADDGFISYGQFRNFALLLPPEQVRETDPSVLWFEAATFVQLRAPAVAAGATGVALLKAALAGALASGSTTALMHPLDTLKTRVQASVGKAPGLQALGRMIPELGARRLYLGIVPAVAGAATSHGIRTASYEWARVMLAPLVALGLPGLSETAVQGIASGFGTFLGTGVRIPNEVLKQRLQTGQHAHVLEAARAVLQAGGARAFFAGTTATLAREVPFYVLGMIAYEKLKALARGVSGHELTPWQTIAVGALSGAIAAVATTPADVLKTRIMTGRAPAGLSALALAQRMVSEEGLSSLYKGAAPRALWIAPLGAMNFAGYELAKAALNASPAAAAEVTAPAPPPPPPPAGARARAQGLASAATAAGAQAGARLRDAAGRAVVDLRLASQAAIASATPRIKHATESGVQLVRAKAAATQTGLKAGAVEAAAACVPTPHSPEVTHTELAAGEALHAQECPAPPAAVEAEAEAVHADISEQPVPEAHSSAEPACEGEAPPAVSEAAVADESAVPGPAAKEEEGPPEGGAM